MSRALGLKKGRVGTETPSALPPGQNRSRVAAVPGDTMWPGPVSESQAASSRSHVSQSPQESANSSRASNGCSDNAHAAKSAATRRKPARDHSWNNERTTCGSGGVSGSLARPIKPMSTRLPVLAGGLRAKGAGRRRRVTVESIQPAERGRRCRHPVKKRQPRTTRAARHFSMRLPDFNELSSVWVRSCGSGPGPILKSGFRGKITHCPEILFPAPSRCRSKPSR